MDNVIMYIPTLLINLLKSIFVSLDLLLAQIFEIVQQKDLDGNNFLMEIFIGITIFIVTVFLGIDTDTIKNEKIYKKKYIIMIYSIIFLVFIFNSGNFDIYVFITTMILVLFLNAISGINTGYNFDLLEKELGLIEILIYSFTGWFYKAKTYISIILLFTLVLFNEYGRLIIRYEVIELELNYLNELIMLIIIILFFLIHLLIDMKDRFGYSSFENLIEKLSEALNLYEKDKEITLGEYLEINEDNMYYIEMLGLILYIEDRDFMDRTKPTYSLHLAVKRKISNMNLKEIFKRKTTNLINNTNYKTTILEKLKYIRKYIKIAIRKIINELSIKCRNLPSNLFRGHSTIEQQIVRNTIMDSYTYNYTFRRKMFIERYYIKYFIKAYKKRKIKDKGIKRKWKNILINQDKRDIENKKNEKRKLINSEIKIEFLVYYYREILKSPKDIGELLDKIESESAQSMKSLLNKEKSYNNSNYKLDIIDKIIKGGKV